MGRYLDIASKVDKEELVSDLTEGSIIAVEICSQVLQADVWLAFDDTFDPGDGQAIFYAHELPLLRVKTQEQLKQIHKAKLALGPGSIIKG